MLAVEMEGAGVADACKNLSLRFTVIRGICDYCDNNKNDHWQFYAAAVAAAYTYCVIERMPTVSRLPLVQTVRGLPTSDFTSIERLGAAAVAPNERSASLTTDIQRLTPRRSVPTIPPTSAFNLEGEVDKHASVAPQSNAMLRAFKMGLEQQLRDMEHSTVNHDWNRLFTVARTAEDTLAEAPATLDAETRAKALYEIARAYFSQSQLVGDNERQSLIDHAKELVRRAQNLFQ